MSYLNLFRATHTLAQSLTHSLTSINSDKRTIVKVDRRLSRRQRHTIHSVRSNSLALSHTHAWVAQESDSMSEIDRTRDPKIIRSNEARVYQSQRKQTKTKSQKENETHTQRSVSQARNHIKFVAHNETVFVETIVNIYRGNRKRVCN